MEKPNQKNIILIGFSGTGKSDVGERVAKLLGWEFVDIDSEIEHVAGKSVPEIFAQDGEVHFRKLESDILKETCNRSLVVISTGGGAVMDNLNVTTMLENGTVICLEAKPETIYNRLLRHDEPVGTIRPLLNTPNPMERITQLKTFRQSNYAISHWTIHTDNLSIPEVCQEVVRGWHFCRRISMHDTSVDSDNDLACEVVTTTNYYPIHVGRGLLSSLGKLMYQAGIEGHTYVISDSLVHPLYGSVVEENLRVNGLQASTLVLPAGEGTKSMGSAMDIYDWLVKNRAERKDTIVALGGGMIGDLAGFVAATFMRGISLVQVPTTLIAMVDSSIGGKTAVNHPAAKNSIGVFHQPKLVIADVETLSSLPTRELTSGWAEVIKHALILDEQGIPLLEKNAERLKDLDQQLISDVIKRSAAIKARVVSQDEREAGLRTLLNYGHTIAHGIETATNYEEYLHGEAVAIGMMGAGEISKQSGLLSDDSVIRQKEILERFGLPVSCPGIDPKAIMKAMEMDKKVRGKKLRWVLLNYLGKATVKEDVSLKVVSDTIAGLCAG
ncbi:MAG: 3-dehydroquinate synthase [Chloroflexota bacterium]|nr:3-dehydroquinate synthase [Chloroflexota bacterium]